MISNRVKLSRNQRRLVVETLEDRLVLAADPIITEFMASNDTTLLDGNGDTPDWIEIYNNGDLAVDLGGYSLTDDATDLNKWQIPSHVLEPNSYLLIFASGNGVADPDGNFHTNFALGASGEYVALSNPSGTVLSEFGASGSNFPAQSAD